MACCRGENIKPCFREEPVNKGRCPVADDAPDLAPEHDVAVDIFIDLLRTAETVDGKRKVTSYIRANEYRSLCDIYDVTKGEALRVWKQILVLEKAWNDTRPIKTGKSGGGSSRARPRRRRL